MTWLRALPLCVAYPGVGPIKGTFYDAGGAMDQPRVREEKRCFRHKPQSRQPKDARILLSPEGCAGGKNCGPVRSEGVVVKGGLLGRPGDALRRRPATNLEQGEAILQNECGPDD